VNLPEWSKNLPYEVEWGGVIIFPGDKLYCSISNEKEVNHGALFLKYVEAKETIGKLTKRVQFLESVLEQMGGGERKNM
jgi:hypothetical protein